MYISLLLLHLLGCTLALDFVSRPEIEEFVACINSGNHRYNYTIVASGQLLLQPYETRLIDENGEDSVLLDCYIGKGYNASYAFQDNIVSEDDLQGSSVFNEQAIDTILRIGWARDRAITQTRTFRPHFSETNLPSTYSELVDSQILRERDCDGLYYGAYTATNYHLTIMIMVAVVLVFATTMPVYVKIQTAV